eukprot:Skav219752  [mRNA]  locus=scaffold569:211421:214202:- [translate_table: standard]
MMWLPMVESDKLPDKLPRNAVVECIKANVSKDSLTVNLCASKVDDTHLSLLARSMHKHLTRVDLNFWMCQRLTGKGVEDLTRQMPSKLKTLKLNFKLLDLDVSGVEKIGDKSMLLLAETLEISSLKNVFLSFRSCGLSDAGVQAIVAALPCSVTLLKMDLADCEISDVSVDALASQLQHMPNLGVIQVNLQGCQLLTEASIARFVAKLPWTLRGARIDLSNTGVAKETQKVCRRLTTMRTWVPTKPTPNQNKTSGGGSSAPKSKDEDEKMGLALQSLDLFLHRGVVQSVPPAVKDTRGNKLLWLQKLCSDEVKGMSRTFSEPHMRQFKPLLPSVVHPAKGCAIALMARPECMYSRPRTSHNGKSEPIWYP